MLQTRFQPSPDMGGAAQPLLAVRGLTKHFPLRSGLLGRSAGTVQAVDGMSFDIRKGETLGLVGESGCGKSTTSRLVMALLTPSAGELVFDGQPIGHGGLSLKEYRRQVQMVFQDSYASLNPRLTVQDSIAFAPQVHGLGRREAVARAEQLLEAVGLSPAQFAPRYPHELSGGLRQRAMIAIALSCRPKLLLADEPTTALDVTVQIQILLLLRQLQAEMGMGVIFVTHDLGVAGEIADRVAVMYAGRFIEEGPVADLMRAPLHPYAQGLLGATVHAGARGKRLATIPGAPPNLERLPPGCAFAPRCAVALPVCPTAVPAARSPAPGRAARCVHVPDLLPQRDAA